MAELGVGATVLALSHIGSGNGWIRYEDSGESLENVVESDGGDDGLKSAREVMILCTIESKPLALPWGRTLRLESGVRVSVGFPSILVALVVARVGPLSDKVPR
ncbi:hypothetical protein Tco_1280565, partial [Tanacetum coccineum]